MSKFISWPFEKTARQVQDTKKGKCNAPIFNANCFSINNDNGQNSL